MESTAFSPLKIVHLPFSSRLLPSSCCPDKDLLLLVSRLGGTDWISLWNSTSGNKVWEIGFEDETGTTNIIEAAWSPDGQSLAILRDLSHASLHSVVSLHSLQDGLKQTTISINDALNGTKRSLLSSGIYWFRNDKATENRATPDILRRGDVITGTALSILRMLPLLDSLQEESEKLTVTDLFAFQGSHTRSSTRAAPNVIRSWPTLPPDLTSASIGSSVQKSLDIGEGNADEVDDSNTNSILLVMDATGNVHCLLDGTFPLGKISLPEASLTSIVKHPKNATLFGNRRFSSADSHIIELWPTTVEFQFLAERKTRDLAKLSSVARELAWYAMRVVKDMRSIWFGSETTSGARELGPKWVRALETKQREQYNQEDPNPVLDLTCLLVTGRASESVSDFLGSGEQMSERGLQKWELTLSEALIKLRDSSEKRVAPACQRLHLILEELRGWAELPQYRMFPLDAEDLNQCLALTGRAIIIANWLSAVSRRELSRFREFISWLRFEASNAANQAPESAPRHDILDVNNYFMSGLVVSSIDKWFLGPVPKFHPRDIGVPGEDQSSLFSVLERARVVINDPAQLGWHTNLTHNDLSHLDRNIDALIQELATKCERVFNRAAGHLCSSAILTLPPAAAVKNVKTNYNSDGGFIISERVIINERNENLQCLAFRAPVEGRDNLLGMIRLNFAVEAPGMPFQVGIALLEYYLPEDGGNKKLDPELLEAGFLDDECVVIIYRHRERQHQTYISTVNYSDIAFQEPTGVENACSREELIQIVINQWREQHVASVRVPIKRRRALIGCKTGGVSLAINGKAGRRVACVLDSAGTTLESFDLEEDGEDLEMLEDISP